MCSALRGGELPYGLHLSGRRAVRRGGPAVFRPGLRPQLFGQRAVFPILQPAERVLQGGGPAGRPRSERSLIHAAAVTGIGI